MNLKEIKEMITLMNENELCELEIEKDGTKIKIKKAPVESSESLRISPPAYRIETIAPPNRPAENGHTPAASPVKTTKDIASPMVGTFYRAPSPESAAFVEMGQTVEIGQVVCIVEAMKLMNEIKSEIRGKVVEIAVENAEPVEFGQTLFVVEPV